MDKMAYGQVDKQWLRTSKGKFASLVVVLVATISVFAGSIALQNYKVRDSEAAGGNVTIEGTLTLFIEDNFSKSKSKDHYTLVTADHRILGLKNVSKLPAGIKLGDKVRITGSLNSGNKIKINSAAKTGNGNNDVGTRTSGQVNVRVFPVRFSTYQSSTLTKAQMQNILNGSSNPISVNKFMKKVSKDRFQFDIILVHDWFTINSDELNNDQICDIYDLDEIEDYLEEHFSLNIFDPSYHSLIFYIDHPCFKRSYAGGKFENGQGAMYIASNHFGEGVISHEMGHNLGMHHANGYDCNDSQYDILDECNSLEYGSPFSVMGYDTHDSSFREYSGAERIKLGWLSPEEILKVDHSGTYTIYPLSGDKVQPKVLEIAKKDIVPDERYYVDFRTPNAPFDTIDVGNYFTTNVFGVGIQSALTQTFIQEHPFYLYSNHSHLLDVNPDSINNPIDDSTDARITNLDKEFIDHINGIRIKLDSVSADKATVNVSFEDNEPGADNLISIRALRKPYAAYIHLNLYLRNPETSVFEKVRTFNNIETGFTTYTYVDTSGREIKPEDVRVSYTRTDANEADNTNYLELRWIEINHVRYPAVSPEAYSVGSWNRLKGRCEAGYPAIETEEFEFSNRIMCPEKYFQFVVPTMYPKEIEIIGAAAECDLGGDPQVMVTWKSDANASLYTLDYCEGSGCFPSTFLDGTPEDNPVNGSNRIYYHFDDYHVAAPGPQAGKTYSYRVRARRTINGEYIFGPWSDTKTITVPVGICD